MGDNLNFGQGAKSGHVRLGGAAKGGSKAAFEGHFKVEHLRMNRETGRREVIATYNFDNDVTQQGRNAILNVMFNGLTQHTSYYLGLIDGAGEVLAATDTYAGINGSNGWGEFSDYTDAGNSDSSTTRPEWNPDDSTVQQVINSSVIVFDITGTGIVHGVFLVSGPNSQTKSDNTTATNRLWATAPFSGGEVSVVNLDQLKTTYYVND